MSETNKEVAAAYLAAVGEMVGRLQRDSDFSTALSAAIDHVQNSIDNGGRIFMLGVGGMAPICDHLASEISNHNERAEIYSATVSTSQITAAANDKKFDDYFSRYLKQRKLTGRDTVMLLSVGGGTDTTSLIIKNGVEAAKETDAKIIGITGKTTGAVYQHADVRLLAPVDNAEEVSRITQLFATIVCDVIDRQITTEGRPWDPPRP